MTRRRALARALVGAALACPSPAAAGASPTAARQAVPRYAADVGAVAIDVVVTDRRGRLVSGLTRQDFSVLERGVPQELSFFTADRTPVTVMVLLDSSASVRSMMSLVQKAANRFIGKLARNDQARIGFFHERVVFGPRFTGDMKEHSAMIKQMRPQRKTHLFDALVESFDLLDPIQDRKALLVFSDGSDQGSRTPMESALEAARWSDVSVYAVGLVGWSADDGMHTSREILSQMARYTGGRAFFPSDDDEMEEAFDRIRTELHHQYRMGYVPAPGDDERPEWRELRVELPRRGDLTVRHRLGYFGGREAAR